MEQHSDYKRLRGSTDYLGQYQLLFDATQTLTEISGNAEYILTWQRRHQNIAYW